MRLTLDNTTFDTVRKAFDAVAGIKKVEKIQSGDDRIHLKIHCDAVSDLRPEIYAAIKATDWLLLEFQLETQTLEDIFRNLTQEN